MVNPRSATSRERPVLAQTRKKPPWTISFLEGNSQRGGQDASPGNQLLGRQGGQEMAHRVLEAIYEPVFVDTSYGFRPGRSGHDALRQLNHEVMREPVHWIADLDLAQFFDTMRIADQNFLRLIVQMLKAGVQTPGGIVYDELGSSQGSIVSPVIANAFLDHVLDQWFIHTVRHHCRGYCGLIRYADGTPVQACRPRIDRRPAHGGELQVAPYLREQLLLQGLFQLWIWTLMVDWARRNWALARTTLPPRATTQK
jgi:hypothetical protein